MMPLHEAAQSVAWFAVVVLVGIAVVLWFDIKREEKRNAKK
jgi:hypothetical protein